MKVSFAASLLFLFSLFPASVQAISNTNTNSLSQEKFFETLPPWATPAVIKSLQKNLPSIYQLNRSDKGYSMRNPSHGIDITFTATGPQFRSGKNTWGMVMTGYGYGESIQPVKISKMVNDDGRMVYDRGELSEWYLNSRWGVEQGFTLHTAPQGGEGLLVLELALSGVYGTKLQANNTLILTDAGGQQIRYSGLKVFDANSRVLPAHFTIAQNILSIHVDDSEARYPVIIDPWIQQVKLTANDGAVNDYFGHSVGVSGDTVVVGAPNTTIYDSGSVYVFEKPVDGWASMVHTAKLTASDIGTTEDFFGESVSISDDTILVGSPMADGRRTNSGAVYVFERPADGWVDRSETAKLTASYGVSGDYFGGSVSIAGDTIVVGAREKGVNFFSSNGVAYVFEKPVNGWTSMTETARLTASDGYTRDNLGWSTAISGDTIVVGAPNEGNSTDHFGAVYVFEKPPLGWSTMTQTAKLTASEVGEGDFFGGSVAISNDTVVVGAPANDTIGYNAGSAYIFEKMSNGWEDATEVVKLTASDGGVLDEFGGSVSISDNKIIIGGMGNSSMDYRSGSVYVFIKPVDGWSTMDHTVKATATDGASSDRFGWSVALDGNMVVAGTPRSDSNGSNSGSVYISFIKALVNAYADSNGTLSSSTPSPQIVDYYSTTEFVFNADQGYHIASISGCGIDFANSEDSLSNKSITTDSATGDCTVLATFTINQNTVTAVAGAMGSLDPTTPSPQTVNDGETTQFTFNADAGYHVESITGCGVDFTNSDNSLVSKTIATEMFTESCVVTATFAIDQYTVVASAGANGRLSEFTPASQIVNYGQIVYISYFADEGYHVESVTGCGVEFTNSDDTVSGHYVSTDPFTESCVVSATFGINQDTVIAIARPGGMLDPATPSPRYGNDDEIVQFSFNADAGYHVESVSGCGVNYTNSDDTLTSKTVSIDPFTESCVVNATFAINQATVIAKVGENGLLDPATPSPQTASVGETKQITFNADAGYHVASVIGCGISFTNSDETLTSETVTTEPFTESCVVSAVFAINRQTVIVNVGEGGSLNEGTPLFQRVNPEDTVELIFNADVGYHVVSINGCGISFYNTENSIDSKTVTTDPFTTSCTVAATFALNHYNVSVAFQSLRGTVDASTPSPQIVDYGETVQFTVNAHDGYHLRDIRYDISTGPPCGNLYFNQDDTITNKTVITNPITDDCRILVDFSLNEKTVTGTAWRSGSLDVTTPSPQTVDIGTTVQFTFNADTGHHIATISGCGIDFTNTDNGINVTTVTTDPFSESCAVNADFAINKYTVSASAGSNGTLDSDSSSSQIFNHGESAQFTFRADTGYHIESIAGCGVDFIDNSDTTIVRKMVLIDSIESDCEVHATFAHHNNTTETAISFEGFSTGSFGTGVESGFEISVGNANIKDGLSCNSACVFNSTQYLNIPVQILSQYNPTTIKQISGTPFNLLSFDFAEEIFGLPYPNGINVIGTLLDGRTITESFYLDGINDGSGPLDDFQTVFLPDSFKHLISVTFVGWGNSTTSYSIDNVVVQDLAENNILIFMPAILSAVKNRTHL